MEVEVRILDERLRSWGFPAYGSALAAGLDLFACIDGSVCLRPQGRPQLISSGLSLRIGSPDWCAMVVPRSGLAHHDGLVLGNTIGIVDPDYTGPCLVSVWNRNPPSRGPDSSDDGIVIRPGDRIAQLIFIRITRPEFRLVDAFSAMTDRGGGGFGSTGVSSKSGEPQRDQGPGSDTRRRRA